MKQLLKLTSVTVVILGVACTCGLEAQCRSQARSPDSSVVSNGWQVRSFVTDHALHRQWKIVTDCNHPQSPAKMLEIPYETSSTATVKTSVLASYGLATPVQLIASGSPVNVWWSGIWSRGELNGVALSGGLMGDRITVHLSGRGIVKGQVTGVGLVRLEEEKSSWN